MKMNATSFLKPLIQVMLAIDHCCDITGLQIHVGASHGVFITAEN
jgi:hypothetical protein